MSRKEKDRFYVDTPGWTYEGDALILACGSKASLDGSEDGYGYAKEFGQYKVKVVIKSKNENYKDSETKQLVFKIVERRESRAKRFGCKYKKSKVDQN